MHFINQILILQRGVPCEGLVGVSLVLVPHMDSFFFNETFIEYFLNRFTLL